MSGDRGGGQHVEEQGIGARVVADLRRPAARRGWRRASQSGGFPAPRARRARTARPAGPDPREEIVGRERQPAAVEHEAVELLRPPAERRQARSGGPCAPTCSSSWARNRPVRSPTVFALQEIELHEALDRRLARAGRRSASRSAICRCMSKLSRSSARPATRWRWQRTAQKKRSARSNRRNSAGGEQADRRPARRPLDADRHICRSSRACGGREGRPCRP